MRIRVRGHRRGLNMKTVIDVLDMSRIYYERTMNLKKALKKTKAALRDLETTGPKSNNESQKKTVVECLEDIEEIDTR